MLPSNNLLVNQNVSRLKQGPENKQLILRAIKNYYKKNAGNQELRPLPMNQAQLARFSFMTPLAMLTCGIITSYTFVNKRSKYIGKIIPIAFTFVGIVIGGRYTRAYESSLLYHNFDKFPPSLQRMIDNNDFRYGVEYLEQEVRPRI